MTNFFKIPRGRFACDETQQDLEPTLKRNGFVTFWLVLLIIAGIYGCIKVWGYIDDFNKLTSVFDNYNTDFDDMMSTCKVLLWASLLGCVCYIFGAIRLLSWRKMGFTLIVVTNIIVVCIAIFFGLLVSDKLSDAGLAVDLSTYYVKVIGYPLLSCFILWAVLQIKQDGVSCWSQLH